jgi:hypothetical protein
LTEGLPHGFSSEYIDPEGTVAETVSGLRANMDRYAQDRWDWIAPYTSFVTSSMMGKTRHMKEVANHLPCVYMCLRKEGIGFGYPHRSPSIANWSTKGATTVVCSAVSKEVDFCFSTFRWSAFILSTICKLTTWINDGRFFTSLGIDSSSKVREFEYAWLWKFFAEPLDSGKLTDFWVEVQNETTSMLQENASGYKARAYFHLRHPSDVKKAMEQLQGCFVGHGINDKSEPLILIFDEARTLCGI